MNILTIEDIAASYPGMAAPLFSHVTLSLLSGEKTGLVGPNGSGKTTLFRIMVGLAAPTAGRILFKGGEITDQKGFSPLRRAVGMVFQNADDQLFSPTVLEDVAFGPLNLGLTPSQARQRALGTLESLAIGHLAERLTHTLSGGEKRMCALATVLSMRPEALLLDEPTNDLDPATRERLIEVLAGLPQALLVISHDYDFLAQTTSALCAMKDGGLTYREEPAVHQHPHIHPHGDLPHAHEGFAPKKS